MPPREPVLYCLKAESIPRPSAFHTRTMPLPSPVTSREPAGFQSKKRTPPLLVECAVSLEHTQSSLPPLLELSLLLVLKTSLVLALPPLPLLLPPAAFAADEGVMAYTPTWPSDQPAASTRPPLPVPQDMHVTWHPGRVTLQFCSCAPSSS